MDATSAIDGVAVSWRLSAVPAASLRDGIYVRVSAIMGRTDDRFLSPEIQRQQIDKSRRRGPSSRVVHQWDDIDVSTAKVPLSKRPGLQAALQAGREGKIDRLWILTLDRFDRDTAAMKVFDEIVKLGIELWTESGRVDVETPEGYLSTTMQLAIARYQRDRIGKAWKQTHQHRIDRGLPHSGKARFGYTYDKESGRHVPDTATAPFLAAAYARYIDGESVYALVRWLNAEGITTTEGNPWRDRVLRRVLDSGFAAGILTYGEQVYDGIHEPLITRRQWEAYQAARLRRRVQVNTERSQYVLSGMVRCGQCGGAMVAGQYGAGRTPKYRCARGKETGAHLGGYVMASYVEAEVLAWLSQIGRDIGSAIKLEDAAKRRLLRNRRDSTQASRRLDALTAELQELIRHLTTHRITEAEFDQASDAIRVEQDALRQQIAEAALAESELVAIKPQLAAKNLLAQWDELDVLARREALHRLIKQVRVVTGRPRASVTVIPSWE